MNWYLAKIVFRIICGDGNHIPQFDEQLRLVNADSKEHAFYKAGDIGRREEESFFNSKQQLVRWQFINVCEIYRLSELIDGAEMYSRIEERDDAEAYIHVVNKKSANVLSDKTLELLQLA